MKVLSFILICGFAKLALAQNSPVPPNPGPVSEPIIATGTASGTCDGGPFASSCLGRIGMQAEQQANMSLVNECFERGGSATLGNFCSHNCNPAFIFENQKFVFVNCSANCEGDCRLH